MLAFLSAIKCSSKGWLLTWTVWKGNKYHLEVFPIFFILVITLYMHIFYKGVNSDVRTKCDNKKCWYNLNFKNDIFSFHVWRVILSARYLQFSYLESSTNTESCFQWCGEVDHRHGRNLKHVFIKRFFSHLLLETFGFLLFLQDLMQDFTLCSYHIP